MRLGCALSSYESWKALQEWLLVPADRDNETGQALAAQPACVGCGSEQLPSPEPRHEGLEGDCRYGETSAESHSSGQAGMAELWNKPESSDPSKDVCTGIFVMKDVNRQPGLK